MNKFFNFLGLAKRSGNLIEGYSKCNEQRNRIKIYLFIISKDASESTRKKFLNHCNINNILYIEDFSKEELGISIGREEVKILAISDENMAKKLNTLYEEGKNKI
ncbi:ribosomal L7Ae/L30e/S12e/Gadd45 family protein [Clostridium septicum]|uniref:50S ribosomal protein L7ae-like protein n=1 Tax=Clostridium septicum TaxID=1504 RepID=A0A9N7JIL8_CLOSE|nr:ribosomal L7Ae/L30e/S12e/Gadd45 family protein [Clostridium septicum]AYE33068.1 50S ribosomal protein L7ae-like protein [Clostridium septicum]MDU1314520.1 ribosomal L7Ae/L30e/S12e/Gadd45 family protein [Clostridium septicum]QAS61237.1 50S ribosomal protein L7ae-like protein [Clostridium septicum]UEC19410.1 ribosomal L7Ae/L30e/S12e/Gadd45 family protein [Clostridium septicum]USR99637.1 ribosomal L7Ae/L30e/S12e/Gadd45 family protein [Clostridium septicum]